MKRRTRVRAHPRRGAGGRLIMVPAHARSVPVAAIRLHPWGLDPLADDELRSDNYRAYQLDPEKLELHPKLQKDTIYLVSVPPENQASVADVLMHEHIHHLLSHTESAETSRKFDNIARYGERSWGGV